MALDVNGDPMGPAEVRELASLCLELHVEVLRLYISDLEAWHRRGAAGDDGQAWQDFHGHRLLLARLCDRALIDAEPCAQALERILAGVHAGRRAAA